MVNGIKQKPIEGVSMAYTFDEGECQGAVEARHAIFRDVLQPRHLSRRLVCLHDAARPAWLMGTEQDARRQRLQVGTLQHHRGLTRRTTISRPRIPTSSRKCRRCSWRRRQNTRSCPWITRSSRAWLHRDQARSPGKRSSPTRVRMPAFPSAMLRAFWTRTTPSPPRSPFPKAARRE